MDPRVLAQVPHVLARYAQPGLRLVGELGRSTRNYNFIVESRSSDRYALRMYRKHVDVKFVGFLLQFQRHLQACGLLDTEYRPCPRSRSPGPLGRPTLVSI